MATIAHTTVKNDITGGWAGTVIAVWADMSQTDDIGNVFEGPSLADRTVQITGTFGGGTLRMEGSLDGVTYFTLTDLAAAAVSVTADSLVVIRELVRFIRPVLTGATAGNVKVCLLARQP